MNHKITKGLIALCIVVKVIALSFITYKLTCCESAHRIVLSTAVGILLSTMITDAVTLIFYKKTYE